MAEYKVVITNNGLDRLEQAMADKTKLVLSKMAFGDAFGEEYIPTVNQTALKHEIFRKDLTEKTVADGQVKYKTVLLSSDPTGNYVELGLYLDDDTLFAVANIPKLEHRQATSGSATETDITLVMVAENADYITLNIKSEAFLTKDYANQNYLRLDGESLPTADLSLNSHKISDVKAGSLNTDAANVSQLTKIGSLMLWAGVANPSDCIDADGASYSRLGEMAALYARIGTLYGSGDGNLTFNVPKIDSPLPETPLRWIIKYRY